MLQAKLPISRTTNFEDALYRLAKLTQEEARMALAQYSARETHMVDESVGVVANTVVVINNGASNGVAGVGNQVASVDDIV